MKNLKHWEREVSRKFLFKENGPEHIKTQPPTTKEKTIPAEAKKVKEETREALRYILLPNKTEKHVDNEENLDKEQAVSKYIIAPKKPAEEQIAMEEEGDSKTFINKLIENMDTRGWGLGVKSGIQAVEAMSDY